MGMKRADLSIKKRIKRQIELKHPKPKMNSRQALRTKGKPKPIHVELLSRSELRRGVDPISTFKPILKNKSPVSIVVTAHNAVKYIEECLDSIENQTYFIENDDFEVLVGVDGCKETLDKILSIRHKYRNLRVFMMLKNVGTFITTNTLIDIMKTNNFIRFDSDDIMLPEMVNEIMYYSDDFEVVKFSYFNFNGNGYYRLKNIGNKYAAGVIFFRKKVFDLYGGYQPWICTAEGEILVRIGDDLKTKAIDDGLFRRRVHNASLTQNNDTGMRSELRKEYHVLIEKSRKNKTKFIKRIMGEYHEYI